MCFVLHYCGARQIFNLCCMRCIPHGLLFFTHHHHHLHSAFPLVCRRIQSSTSDRNEIACCCSTLLLPPSRSKLDFVGAGTLSYASDLLDRLDSTSYLQNTLSFLAQTETRPWHAEKAAEWSSAVATSPSSMLAHTC